MLNKFPNALFIMAGVGDLLEAMKRLVESLGIQQSFTFTGFLNEDEVICLLERSHIYVMPSIFEPFGIGALEAIRKGVPVVVPLESGIAECVEDVWGVDTKNPEAVAVAIGEVLLSPEAAFNKALRAQSRAGALDWNGAAVKLYSCYQQSRLGLPQRPG